ncbi:DUF4278 domain-containing protein [Halioxenophilus sp. WMMB6]|uniref:DUF4278 domain-containing protein n=1 Tax=Halioxenophilus sp. WMMB6 TaxID=3073815 RepID=UPI00295E7904|nr:DUF4278 domain-containing protein [Halioxenophilus sp. WMMB6]
MSAIYFSTENLIALNKLEASVRKESGVRHVLSEERSLIDLIKMASVSSSIQIQTSLFNFLQGLSSEQKNQLVYRGVSFSRAEQRPVTESDGRVVERTYRGVKVATQAPASVKAEEPAVKKPVRIYRGRVITD